jgi:hypothetical protein
MERTTIISLSICLTAPIFPFNPAWFALTANSWSYMRHGMPVIC